MSFTKRLFERMCEANIKFSLISENERVLVGFSGGADSLALVDALHELIGENVYALQLYHKQSADHLNLL